MIDDNNNIFQINYQIQTIRKDIKENEKGNDDNFEQLEFN